MQFKTNNNNNKRKKKRENKYNNNNKIFRTKLSAKFFANTYFLTIYKTRCNQTQNQA